MLNVLSYMLNGLKNLTCLEMKEMEGSDQPYGIYLQVIDFWNSS